MTASPASASKPAPVPADTTDFSTIELNVLKAIQAAVTANGALLRDILAELKAHATPEKDK